MKHIKKVSDSKSLLNYTLSPGWSTEEVEVLKIALMKYGIGKWKKIKKSNCLPGKTIAQMNLQTQRLLGQQSLAEFMGLKLNMEKIFKYNKKKQSNEVLRKNNFIINTGDNLTQKERSKRIKENKIKYKLEKCYLRKLKIPKLLSQSIGHYLTLKQINDPKNNLSIVEKIVQCKNIIKCMNKKIEILNEVEKEVEFNEKYNTLIFKRIEGSNGNEIEELYELIN